MSEAEEESNAYPKTFLYKGTVLSKNLLPDPDLLNAFQPKEDDVFVCTFPKSGTHFLCEMTYLVMHDGNTDMCEKVEQMKRWGALEGFQHPYNIHNLSELPSPRLIFSHFPYDVLPDEVKNHKIIYMARNPKDTFASYYYFHKNLEHLKPFNMSPSQMLKYFLQNKTMYSPYVRHVKQFWERRNDPNILFLFYEDTLSDPASTVMKICKFLGKDLSDDCVQRIVDYTKFDNMKAAAKKSLPSNRISLFYRNGKIGGWMKEMDEEMIAEFDSWIQKHFNEDSGPVFKFTPASSEINK